MTAKTEEDNDPGVIIGALAEEAKEVEKRLRELPGVENVLVAGVGGAAKIVESALRSTL